MNIKEIRKNFEKTLDIIALPRRIIETKSQPLEIRPTATGITIGDKTDYFVISLTDDEARKLRDILNEWYPKER